MIGIMNVPIYTLTKISNLDKYFKGKLHSAIKCVTSCCRIWNIGRIKFIRKK
jgi:hypothetical protein